MSYQVLARKWRPGTFRAMVGQEHVLKALINALDQNRLHHAYLFTGTRGVGKTTIARILAKCLNCETGISSEPCGECGACREIAEGRFIDLIEVDAASRTKVEDTRELLENVQYAPTRGRYKIYLIDEVHMLSNHSFNALLKTLEEPPEHVKFLLATTDPQKLPVTILSRCLQFNLKNMSPEKIVEHLKTILDKEVIPYEEAALWLLARAADGSMRDALSLTDQAISYGSEKIVEQDVATMLGTIDHALIQKIVDALILSDAKNLLKAVEEFAEHSPDFSVALNDLLALLHRIAIVQALPEALDNSQGDKKQVMEFASKLAPEDVQLFYQTALIGRRDLHLASTPRAGFEMTLLRMLAFKPQGLVNIPQKPLQELSQELSQEPSQEPSQEQQTQKKQAEETVPVKKSLTESDLRSQGDRSQDRHSQDRNSQDIHPPLKQASSTQELKAQVKALVGKEGFTAVKTLAQEEAQAGDKAEQGQNVTSIAADLGDAPSTLEEFTLSNWIALYQVLNVKGILQSTVANSVFMGREENICHFALDENKSSLYDPSHNNRLAALLSDYFKQSVRAEIHLKALDSALETPTQYAERIRRERKAAAIQTLQNDPVVKILQERFGAVLDEDSVSFNHQ